MKLWTGYSTLGTAFFALVLTAACGGESGREDDTVEQSHLNETIVEPSSSTNNEEILERVLRKDFTVLSDCVGASSSLLNELISHVNNDDEEVRELVLSCLDESGGQVATQLFVAALSDDSPQVRSVALNALYERPDPNAYRSLVGELDRNDDSYVRQQVALLLGRFQGTANISDLKARLEREQHEQAREGIIAALAKMGDELSIEVFREGLQHSSGRDRSRYLEYVEYINASWILPDLVFLLDDETPVMRIGVDAMPELPHYLRVCDIAINLASDISGQSFSFPISGSINYTQDQRDEVTNYLRSLSDS